MILADGNVEALNASGCVIVARGAVSLERSEYCVIAAGAFVNITMYDGSPRDSANGSVILSRGWANVASAYGSLILAHEGTLLGNASDARFINAAFVGSEDRGGNRTLRVRGLPVEELPEPPFARPLQVLGLVRPDAGLVDTRLTRSVVRGVQQAPPLGVVLRYGERRYFAPFGEPIVDQDGKAVEDLRGWEVSFADSQLAILSSDAADAPVRLEGR